MAAPSNNPDDMEQRDHAAQIHAGAVAIGGRGVMISGASGSGKTGLALMLIDRGAKLIGDDIILLAAKQDRLLAKPPQRIAGMIELRNLGVFEMPFIAPARLALEIHLDAKAERYIEQAEEMHYCGLALPMIRLAPNDPALAIKAELALAHYGLKFEANGSK